MSDAILSAKDRRASYVTHLFGIDREVKVVDGVNLTVRKNEVYGIA